MGQKDGLAPRKAIRNKTALIGMLATANPSGLTFRTSNPRELAAAQDLMSAGYTVVRRGWPDLLAVIDGHVRAIEVKDSSGSLKQHQVFVAAVLSRLGVETEVWANGREANARSWRHDLDNRGRDTARYRELARDAGVTSEAYPCRMVACDWCGGPL